MTAIGQQEIATVRADSAQLERTFAMTLVGVACWLTAGGLASFLFYLIFVYAPAIGNQRLAANLSPIFTLMVAAFVVFGTLALLWTGARRRAWFWWAPVILSLLVMAFNAQDLPYDLARPTNTGPFLVTIVTFAGEFAAIVGGVVAFLEVRRGRPIWMRSGRVAWLPMAGIGVVVGAALTGLLAGAVPTGGPALAEAPTATGFMTTEGNAFVGSSLHVKDGELLGLIITNPQDAGHSFDIDSLGIHVQLSPNSSTAVMIRPTEPGQLEFYCSVHTHREAGMVGAISVE